MNPQDYSSRTRYRRRLPDRRSGPLRLQMLVEERDDAASRVSGRGLEGTGRPRASPAPLEGSSGRRIVVVA